MADKTELTANINAAQCIKTATHAGYDTVTNICTGKVTIVEWGSFDWIGNILLVFGGLALVLLLLAFVCMMIRMVWEGV